MYLTEILGCFYFAIKFWEESHKTVWIQPVLYVMSKYKNGKAVIMACYMWAATGAFFLFSFSREIDSRVNEEKEEKTKWNS